MSTGDLVGYRELVPGTAFPMTTFTLTPKILDQYLAATGCTCPCQLDGRRLAPITIAAVFTSPRMAFSPRSMPPGAIHARQRYTVRRPILEGETFQNTTLVADRYERNSRPYVQFRVESRDGQDRLVLISEMTLIWPEGGAA